jgi:hypothetical protein
LERTEALTTPLSIKTRPRRVSDLKQPELLLIKGDAFDEQGSAQTMNMEHAKIVAFHCLAKEACKYLFEGFSGFDDVVL